MRSKSFETQEVREIGQKEAGESRRFPIIRMGICLLDGRKRMQKPRKIENVKKKIYDRARKVL